MITAGEIRNQQFDKSLRGYDTGQVNAYLLQVANDYEKIYSDHASLRETVQRLEYELQKYRLFSGVRAELEETVALLKVLREEFKPGIAAPSNQARDIAARLKNGIPVIWGTAGISETVALRWKTQINENAKCPAYYNIFPELNHNELVGFETPAGILSQTSIIILQDAQDNERVQKRIEITSSVIKDQVKDIINIRSRGASYLARFFSLAYLGDYVSVYLADEYGIDPTPVAVIDYLKAELAKC